MQPPTHKLPGRRNNAQRLGRRILTGLFLFVVCVLVVDALVGDQGLVATIRARKQYDELAADIARLRSENSGLREEARRLREDPAAIEEIARRELGLMSPGENCSSSRHRPARREVAPAFMSHLIDFVLHFDRHLLQFVQQYGAWVYGILFAIVFAETGLVVAPFLPGDSLLFAVGALSATGVLNPWLCYGLLIAAAILGDAVNYSVGRRIGPRLLGIGEGPAFSHRLINPEHVKRAHEFFELHGGKAVVLARFVPIVRTFLPFVAGAAEMTASYVSVLQHHGRHRVGHDLHGRRLPFRQRADHQGQLHARHHRHRVRVGAADGVRNPQASKKSRR